MFTKTSLIMVKYLSYPSGVVVFRINEESHCINISVEILLLCLIEGEIENFLS